MEIQLTSFLEHAATAIYDRFGEECSSLRIVFPSKRARLFFGDALSRLIRKPIWQPSYISIDDLVQELSPTTLADTLPLIAELYSIYREYHPEEFDKFYPWGVMLLADFDMIDKYMVDAETLYSNISDIRQIEARFADTSDEFALIKNFWSSFANSQTNSYEQQQFLEIWQSLYPIYSRYRARLEQLGIAYSGMIYRHVAEHLPQHYDHTYCFLGFNALNECERRILRNIDRCGNALFWWDYNPYYLDDPHQEAGHFIRRNIREFGNHNPLPPFEINPRVEIISTPSDVTQCKVAGEVLNQIFQRQGHIDKETAIVLTDESLLTVLLHSIPESASRINITMGYPLTASLEYALLERLIQLQVRRRDDLFYHIDVMGLLQHPYIKESTPTDKTIALLSKNQSIYINRSELCDFDIFEPQESPASLSEYFCRTLERCYRTDCAERNEILLTMVRTITKLRNTVTNCSLEISKGVYLSLLRQALRQVRIPYEGEPLGGLQIMGILETRNVDFRNVIILSMDDENFPSTRAAKSYIPHSLRQAFSLPTPSDHEAMYGYYFYRLIQRSENLTLIYNSSTQGDRSGEKSRYIYQLEFESPFAITHRNIGLNITSRQPSTLSVTKSESILSAMRTKKYAPSHLSHYITCPLKFYFSDIAYIRKPDELSDTITKLDLGNVIHHSLEELYTPLIGRHEARRKIRSISHGDITRIVSDVMKSVASGKITDTESSGIYSIYNKIAIQYVSNIVLFDARRGDEFTLQSFESEISGTICGMNFKGYTDRVDRLADGSLSIIDYKSGQGDESSARSLEDLFNPEKSNSALLQTLIYSILYAQAARCDVTPRLYIARNMSREDYSPRMEIAGESIDFLSPELRDRITEQLGTIFESMLDANTPFIRTDNIDSCKRCDYSKICGRA